MKIDLLKEYDKARYEDFMEENNPASATSAVILAEESIKDKELFYKAYERYCCLLIQSDEPENPATAANIAHNLYNEMCSKNPEKYKDQIKAFKDLEIIALEKGCENWMNHSKRAAYEPTRRNFVETAENQLKEANKLKRA